MIVLTLQALLGFEKEFTHIDGEKLTIKNPK